MTYQNTGINKMPAATIPLIDPLLSGLKESEAVSKFLESLKLPATLLFRSDATAPLRFLFINQALENMSGFEGADLIGESPRLLLGEDTDYQAALSFRQEVEQVGQAFTTMTHYRKNGTSHEVFVLGARVTPLAQPADEAAVFAFFVFHLADNMFGSPRPPLNKRRPTAN
ncbi:PAS domain S-box protein [uncultured Tateyamaria sp.]|uniref:PAS domain S-box protein n=1 Tax=uncultured Tateyamaria sp. TaxID=455651 RepID=UPI0026234AE4|nr:PAS domain S-box protein [uncultured Tateyamaria sp.]